MNDTTQYLMRVERELRATRAVSDQSCSEFSALPVPEQLAFAAVIEFLGCRQATVADQFAITPIADEDRIRVITLMYLKLFVDTGDPRWSSLLLERLVKATMAIPGSGVNDVLYALFLLLSEDNKELTPAMVSFLKQIVVLCFSSYRKSYNAADFSWLQKRASNGFTFAQAYLALFACPPSLLSTIRETILKTLNATPYGDEAVRVLSDD